MSSIATKLIAIAQNEQKVYKAGYDKGYDEGYASGKEEGGSSAGSESGSGSSNTDVTNLFGSMCFWINTATENSTSFTMAGGGTGYAHDYAFDCRYGTVTAGEKYQVHCFPTSSNLWENFLLANDDYSTLAVTANDASVGQYVTKASENVYDITIPDGCEQLHINYTHAYGIKIYLLE